MPDFSRESGVLQFLDIATKWPYNWSAGFIFGATGIASGAPSIKRGNSGFDFCVFGPQIPDSPVKSPKDDMIQTFAEVMSVGWGIERSSGLAASSGADEHMNMNCPGGPQTPETPQNQWF